MIDYIERRLRLWALWRLRGGTAAAGYARISWARLVTGEPSDSAPPEAFIPLDDLECSRTDAVVCSLRPPDALLCLEVYTRTQTFEQLARRLRIGSERTLYRRLHWVHQEIDRRLHEVDARQPSRQKSRAG